MVSYDLKRKTMRFADGQDMLATIQQGVDLYNRITCKYVFLYNDSGSIAVYDITPEQADKLTKEEEYWGAYLGPGGIIYDPVSDDDSKPNLSWCTTHFSGEWEDVTPNVI